MRAERTSASGFPPTGDNRRSVSSTNYRPGVCNIGSPQRRRRYALGTAALGAAVGYAAACLAGALPEALLIGVFVPLTLGFELVIQARQSFCARLAYLGRYEFAGDGGETDAVSDSTDRRTDRVRAVRITAVSVAAAAAATLALVVAA